SRAPSRLRSSRQCGTPACSEPQRGSRLTHLRAARPRAHRTAEIPQVTVTHRPILRRTAVHAACVVAALQFAGCTSTEGLLSGDKIDYRSASKTSKTNGLEVPPDLTQLSQDSRYRQSGRSEEHTSEL